MLERMIAETQQSQLNSHPGPHKNRQEQTHGCQGASTGLIPHRKRITRD